MVAFWLMVEGRRCRAYAYEVEWQTRREDEEEERRRLVTKLSKREKQMPKLAGKEEFQVEMKSVAAGRRRERARPTKRSGDEDVDEKVDNWANK